MACLLRGCYHWLLLLRDCYHWLLLRGCYHWLLLRGCQSSIIPKLRNFSKKNENCLWQKGTFRVISRLKIDQWQLGPLREVHWPACPLWAYCGRFHWLACPLWAYCGKDIGRPISPLAFARAFECLSLEEFPLAILKGCEGMQIEEAINYNWGVQAAPLLPRRRSFCWPLPPPPWQVTWQVEAQIVGQVWNTITKIRE